MNLTPRLSPDQLRIFTARIRQNLEERPLVLAREEHLERVAAQLRQFGQSNHYEQLGVSASASAAEVHGGFERTARIVHPLHAARLELVGREGVLEMLFEHVTEAYLTLSQLERRKEYDRTLPPEAFAPPTQRKARPDEQKEWAQLYFNKAQMLVAHDDYHFAVPLLRDAVRLDPQADYFILLGQVQAKNEHWLHHAAESYRRALELGGSNPAVEAALRRLEAKLAGEAPDPNDETHGDGDSKRWFVP